MRGFGATLLASFSIQAVSSFVKGSIEAFRVQEKAVAKVTQAVKSTGGAAGKTSEELQKMASSLQKNTLFGDEEILNKVTAQLLTFTNIAGPQFDRTQQAALDLATVLDGDLQSASIQLGKALNDPAKNLSALSRSGIQFSKEQIATIKSLQETNQLAEAQNIILTELERQYGGQAKAAAEVDGGITQLSNAFGDFKEQVGKQLLEALKPTIKSLKEFFENLTEEDVKSFVGVIMGFGRALANIVAVFGSYKLAALAAAKVNSAFGKSLPTKSFGALGIAITGAYLAFKDLTRQYKEANFEAERFAAMEEKRTDLMAEETDQLLQLGEQLVRTTAASEERQQVIDEINEKYGTTLENLEDEAAFAEQVAAAYKDIVAQLEKKIEAQVIEEELLDATKNLRELEKKLKDVEEAGGFGGIINLDELRKKKEAARKFVNELKGELADLQIEQKKQEINNNDIAESEDKVTTDANK
jgi:hypothetical protein